VLKIALPPITLTTRGGVALTRAAARPAGCGVARAAEKLFAGEGTVTEGRLYFCTSTGGFAEQTVLLNRPARDAALRSRKPSAMRSRVRSCRPHPPRDNASAATTASSAARMRSTLGAQAARNLDLLTRCGHCHDRPR